MNKHLYLVKTFGEFEKERERRNLPSKDFLDYKDMWKMEAKTGQKNGIEIRHVKEKGKIKPLYYNFFKIELLEKLHDKIFTCGNLSQPNLQ